MRRLALALVAALAAGSAGAQTADDAIGQLLNAQTQTAEPTPTVPAADAPPVPAPGAVGAPANPTPAPSPTTALGETISTAAPPQPPTEPPLALTTVAAPAPAPAQTTDPTPSPPVLAVVAPSAQPTPSAAPISPAQAEALQAAVMAPRPAAVAESPKDPQAPPAAYSTLSSATRAVGDADEDSAPASQGDNTYSNWSDPVQRPAARQAYGRYGVARPTYAASNPGLPYTRYSQVTRPVQLAETGVSADQPMTSQDVAYESRMRQAFSAAENAQGPMDGRWVLMGPEGRLYAFQVVDRGQTLEGVWTDLRRPPGALETAGLIEQLSRDGDSLTVRFTAPRGGGPVSLTLRSAPGGTWAGQMNGAASQVTLRRD